MDSNFLRSCRSGKVSQADFDRCAEERGHATPDRKGKCWMCGYKFTEEELNKKLDDERRRNFRVI